MYILDNNHASFIFFFVFAFLLLSQIFLSNNLSPVSAVIPKLCALCVKLISALSVDVLGYEER